MNYLAHAYLSFNHPGILVGNMISDFVKGKKKFNYDLPIQQGIQLHREIDQFTDTHPETHRAKEIFRPVYRLYSGAIMDVIYDYFLANDAEAFPGNALEMFSEKVYATLDANNFHFPPNFARMFPHMKKNNWLLNYRYKQGIAFSLGGLERRAKFMPSTNAALALFESQEEYLSNCYRNFFPALRQFAQGYLRDNLAA
jgi:acyl carrier protein phosphodiesterase